MNLLDLTGQKFGKLTVVKRGENTKSGSVRWWCRCDCGNPELVLICRSCLTKGTTQSCGCLRKELVSKRKKKYNSYDLSGEYGTGYTSKGEEFYFDLEDYDKIKNYCWFIDDKGYVVNRDRVKLHRIIMNVQDKHQLVDHIHGKETRYDNRKSNLRIVDASKNQMNVGLCKNNHSGVTGVSWCETANCWRARLYKNRKLVFDEFYINFEDAAKARKEAEEKYFGEYSYDYSQAI